MTHVEEPFPERTDFLRRELENFEAIARHIKPDPGDLPELRGIDIYGETLPLNGVVGGDHIIYVDFRKRYDLEKRLQIFQSRGQNAQAELLARHFRKAGVLIADVSGHRITDAMLAAMLHQAFLMGVRYELTQNGEVTPELFENINSRIYNSSSFSKFITMIYGEISEEGRFRFVNAGHPRPAIFSALHDRLVPISEKQQVSFPPIGTIPSREDVDQSRVSSFVGYKDRYQINEITLMGSGDILLLYTDGLSEHENLQGAPFYPEPLEALLRAIKQEPAKVIWERITRAICGFGPRRDDISLVVIKKA